MKKVTKVKAIKLIMAAILIIMLLSACSSKEASKLDNSSNSSNTGNTKVISQGQDKLLSGINQNTESKEVQESKVEGPKSPEKPQIQQTDVKTNENIKKKVIVIDPGHANRSNLEKEPIAPGSSEMKIKDGGGAQGIVTQTPEYVVNMKVAVILKNILEQKGYTVVMTKTQDSQSLGNIERAKVGNDANASLVVRIHADSSDSSAARGASMLVPAATVDSTKSIYSESKRCGTLVLKTLTSEVGMPNRGVVEHNDMTGFNWSKVPVILVEMGFLSNPDEDKLLSSGDYQQKLAKGLADGIEQVVK